MIKVCDTLERLTLNQLIMLRILTHRRVSWFHRSPNSLLRIPEALYFALQWRADTHTPHQTTKEEEQQQQQPVGVENTRISTDSPETLQGTHVDLTTTSGRPRASSPSKVPPVLLV